MRARRQVAMSAARARQWDCGWGEKPESTRAAEAAAAGPRDFGDEAGERLGVAELEGVGAVGEIAEGADAHVAPLFVEAMGGAEAGVAPEAGAARAVVAGVGFGGVEEPVGEAGAAVGAGDVQAADLPGGFIEGGGGDGTHDLAHLIGDQRAPPFVS